MANEINLSGQVSATKNGFSVSASASKPVTMTGDDMIQTTQLIGNAAAELLVFGEITGAPSVLMIKNLDATNYIEVGGDSGLTVFKIKIPAGHFAIFQPTSANVYAQANTAAVRAAIVATEA